MQAMSLYSLLHHMFVAGGASPHGAEHMFVSSLCLVMHMLRGSLSLMVILQNCYVVINTKKWEIESASSPLIRFGINDNIII